MNRRSSIVNGAPTSRRALAGLLGFAAFGGTEAKRKGRLRTRFLCERRPT